MANRRRPISTMNMPSRVRVPAVKAQFNSFGDWWLAGGDLNGISGSQLTFSDTSMGRLWAARYNVWASNCVSARAETLASVDLKLYRKADDVDEEDEIIEDHPIVELLETVNNINLDRRSFIEQIERQLSIHGEAYIHKVRGGESGVSELFILPAQLILAEKDPLYLIREYKYMNNITIPREDMVRIYYPDDADPFFARSPMSSAIMPINNYQLADIAQEGIDRRGGQGGGIISTDFNEISGEPERFMANWDAVRSDPRNAGRDAFLPVGSDYKAGILTAQQQQREQRMERLIKSIMAAFRVPPSLAGDYKDASVLANAAQQSKNFWQTFALFELARISDALTYYLLWAEYEGAKEDRLYLKFDVSSVEALAQGEAEKSANFSTLVAAADGAYAGGLMSLNEARMKIGQEKIDNPKADEIALPVPQSEIIDEETGQVVQEEQPVANFGDGFDDDFEDDEPVEEFDAEDTELSDEISGLLDEAEAVKAGLAIKRDYVRTADGKFGETPDKVERPVNPAFAERQKRRDALKLSGVTTNIKKGKKGKKPKKTEAEKLAEREKKKKERAAERKIKRLESLNNDLQQLEQALAAMQGKDDPSNLRRRIGKALDRLRARIDAVKNDKSSSFGGELVQEVAKLHNTGPAAGKAVPFDEGKFVWAGFYLNSNDARAIEVGPGELPDDAELEERHHVTLYLMPLELFRPMDEHKLVEAIRITTQRHGAFQMQIAGTGVFDNPEQRVVYATPDAPQLADWYSSIKEAWEMAGYGDYVPEHGFNPHITLAYLKPGTSVERVTVPNIPVNVTAFTLSFGNKVYTWPLMLSGAHSQHMPEKRKYIDPVNQVAIAADDVELGTIDEVKRFGEFEGVKATPENPVFIVGGKPYLSSEVYIK